jgi:hypothetical protein
MLTRLTFLAFLAGGAGVLPLLADPPMTRITVEVKNPAGKPVDRAAVIVRFIEGRSVAKFGKAIKKQWEMRTNQEGLARMPALPQGKILVQVIAKGYQTYGQKIDIDEEEKTVAVTVNPPQPQYSAH